MHGGAYPASKTNQQAIELAGGRTLVSKIGNTGVAVDKRTDPPF